MNFLSIIRVDKMKIILQDRYKRNQLFKRKLLKNKKKLREYLRADRKPKNQKAKRV